MSQPYVVDCSFVMAFLLGEDEGERMEAVLRQTVKQGGLLHAPGLLPYEINNVLTIAHRKKRITDRERQEMLDDFFLLPVRCDALIDPHVHRRIGTFAKEHQLTAYDAAYLELADRISAKLLTLDNDLLKLRPKCPKNFVK